MPDQLILFTRFPEPGRVKTRLIPALGAEGASDLHRQLTEHCVDRISPALTGMNLALQVFYSGGSNKLMRRWFPDIPAVQQQGRTLGQRMSAAVGHVRTRPGQRILLFGADCPDLDQTLIHSALKILTNHDLVLGPTFDGGYYLLGIGPSCTTADLNSLLTDIPWGTAEVLEQTLARAEAAGCSYGVLPTLHDIDRPEDLEHFHHYTCS